MPTSGNAQKSTFAQADGREPELLLQGRQAGSSWVSLTQVRFHGGARMRGWFDDIRISFNLSGSSDKRCEWSIAGQRDSHFARDNAAYVCPAATDCAAETDADADILAISIPAERVALAIGALHAPGAHVVPQAGAMDPVLLHLVRALAQEVSGGYANGPLHWHELSDRIVAHVVEHHLSSAYRPIGGILTREALKRVNDLIDARLGEALGLDDLAQAAGQSRFHFERTFTQHMGITPYRYLMHRRLEAAIGMIRSGKLSLRSIAAETGFVDQSHLSRWSKAVRGLRLTEYRKN